MILKPKIAERGNGQFRVGAIGELEQIAGNEDRYLAQTFMPGIMQGELSLAFAGHRLSHAYLKVPGEGDYRCNISTGGKYHLNVDVSPKELAFAQAVLKASEEIGWPVVYSRVDLIRGDTPTLIESENLNPSILARTSGKGDSFAHMLVDEFEKVMS